MEILGYIITILLIALVIFVPVYFTRQGYGFIKSLIISIPLCLLLSVVVYWWNDILPDIRLNMMGYDFDGMNEAERLVNVSPELREEATSLYLSRFGIGWPLKAMFGIGFVVIPYIFISLGGAAVWRKLRKQTPNTALKQGPRGPRSAP